MKKYVICRLMLLLVAMTVSACGFGGFNNQSTVVESTGSSNSSTKISGVVSKGIFKEGFVEIYAVGASAQETLLKTASIGVFGNYSATVNGIKGYAGVVVIKAYGSYLDEATGAVLSVAKELPLRAAIVNPPGEVLAMVTPLTELAVRKALRSGNTLAAADVTAANALVSQLFKVDILETEPVKPDLSGDGFGNAATAQEQKDYTLALATVSQLARDSGTLPNALEILEEAGSAEGAHAFRRALVSFLASDKNLTGVNDIELTNLGSVGGGRLEVKLAVAGRLDPTVMVHGVSLTLGLPPGVTVKGDFTVPGLVGTLEGVVEPSGVMASTSYVEARYLPASGSIAGQVRIALANAGGILLGEFVTVMCEVAPGNSPRSGDFTVSEFTAKDGNGAGLANVDAEISPF